MQTTSTAVGSGSVVVTSTSVPNIGGSAHTITVPNSITVTPAVHSIPPSSSSVPYVYPPVGVPAPELDKTNPYHFSLENEEVRRRWAKALVVEVLSTINKHNATGATFVDTSDVLLVALHGRLLALEVLEPYENIDGEKRPDREKINETALSRKLEKLRERSDETIEMAPGIWKYAIDEIKKLLELEEKADE